MYTYTTPAITCTLEGVDFTNVDYVRVAVKGARCQVLKQVPIEDIDTEEGILVIGLTQEETAALGKGQVTIQARLHYSNGTVQATDKVIRQMDDVLDKVVL
jgi:hypothetical protein